MNKKRLAIGVSILLGVLTLAIASALTINSGECEVINLNTTKSLYWIVSGNSSSMDGMNITYETFGNYTNVTICLHPMFKEDIFTLIFIEEQIKEMVKEVPVYRSGKTKYVDRNITVEKEVDKIVYINQTIELEPPTEPEEKESFLWVYLLCSFVAGIVLTLFLQLFKKSKGGKKNEK